MVRGLWGVDASLGNAYGIQGQNYVVLLHRLITLNVMPWAKWLANQISNPVVQDIFLGGENMNLHLTPDVNQGNRGKVGSRFSCVVSGMDSLFGSSVRC